MSLVNFLIDLIFPPVCLSCDAWGAAICPRCINIFQNRSFSICPCCLKNSPHGLKHDICTHPQKPIDGLVSYWRYTESLKKIITQIKYQGYYMGIDPLVNIFTNQDAIHINNCFQKFLDTKPILVPIPIHSKRHHYRGFNQSEKICHVLAKKWHLPVSIKFIRRHSYTTPQAELNHKQRLQNLVNKFSPTPEILNLHQTKPLKNHNILLIDDVWTTGSTMQNAAITIKNLGAKTIWALTIAR